MLVYTSICWCMLACCGQTGWLTGLSNFLQYLCCETLKCSGFKSIPLCPSSTHPISIHSSLPRTILFRARALAHDKQKAEADVFSIYGHALTHPYTLCNLVPRTGTQHNKKCDQNGGDASVNQKGYGSNIVTFVFRYHEILEVALRGILRNIPLPRLSDRLGLMGCLPL